MPTLRHPAKLRFKTTTFRLSLASALVLGLLHSEAALAASTNSQAFSAPSATAYPLLADARTHDWKPHNEKYREKPKHREKYRHDGKRQDTVGRSRWQGHDRDRRHFTPRHAPSHRVRPMVVTPRHHHHSRDRVKVRPFRYVYPRHSKHRHLHSNDIWGWLAFTAITVAIIDSLNDQQQREHEMALYNATTTPLGETIYWKDGNASGSVTPIQEGTSSSGRYCREFQHEVEIGGERESLYGTACRNPDGSWEIVQ